MNRREFCGHAIRILLSLSLGGMAVFKNIPQTSSVNNTPNSKMPLSSPDNLSLNKDTSVALKTDWVWQIDPYLCTQCGQCATECVLSPSAVKCVHIYALCGYCKLCGGYYPPYAKEFDTAAEHQLCPTKAIQRNLIEDPYYEYTIIEELCIGCGKCVKGCTSFGNGSLCLQIQHNRCVGCNECAIARKCPSQAFRRVPRSSPYLLKGSQR